MHSRALSCRWTVAGRACLRHCRLLLQCYRALLAQLAQSRRRSLAAQRHDAALRRRHAAEAFDALRRAERRAAASVEHVRLSGELATARCEAAVRRAVHTMQLHRQRRVTWALAQRRVAACVAASLERWRRFAYHAHRSVFAATQCALSVASGGGVTKDCLRV